MQILEHGQEHGRTLLFFPCTAEPVWAFADTIAQLSQSWHVFQVVYDGHQPEYPGDFTSVEQTVDEVISYLKSCGISQLDGAYGCSMGGACLTHMLALGKIPIGRAIIDGGITPYQLPFLMRKQLQADGRSKICVYRLVNPDEQQQPKQNEKQIDIESMFNQLRNDVCSEISGIKDLLPTQMSVTNDSTRQQNGGKQR